MSANKTIYERIGTTYYKVLQDTKTPKLIQPYRKRMGCSLETDVNSKVATEYVDLNNLEVPRTRSNRENYNKLLLDLEIYEVKEMDNLQNQFSVYIDYSLYTNRTEIEHSIVMQPIKPVDKVLPLGVGCNSECVYRRIKNFSKVIEFKTRTSTVPYGMMNGITRDGREVFTFKINDISIYQNKTPRVVHKSTYSNPYNIGVNVLENSKESQILVYSTAKEGIKFEYVHLKFNPRIFKLVLDISLANFIVAYTDEEVNKIMKNNTDRQYPDIDPVDPYDPGEGPVLPIPDHNPEADGEEIPDENGYYNYYERCRKTTPHAKLVVEDNISDNKYDPRFMIKKHLVIKDIPSIEVGQYVVFREAFLDFINDSEDPNHGSTDTTTDTQEDLISSDNDEGVDDDNDSTVIVI